jgi:hypothetical protein
MLSRGMCSCETEGKTSLGKGDLQGTFELGVEKKKSNSI